MPSAGLSVDDAIMAQFAQVKMKNGSLDWITMTMKGENKIIMGDHFPKTEEDVAAFTTDRKEGTREENFLTRVWPGFVQRMRDYAATKPKATPVYACINTFFEHNGRKQDRLLFITFVPETANIRAKMIMSATKDSVGAKLEGVHKKFNFTEISDFDWAAILSSISH